MSDSMMKTIRTLAVALGVTIVAAALGAGAGVVLSSASGSDSTAAPVLTNPAPVAEAPAADASVNADTAGTDAAEPTSVPSSPVEVSVRSGRIVPPSTEAGRQRGRLSIRVVVAVSNPGSSTLALAPITLTSGSSVVRNDPRAADAANGLLDPLAEGATVQGELRFETSGTRSASFRDGTQATLRLGAQTVIMRLAEVAPEQ